jgi:predicted transcriptional regulator
VLLSCIISLIEKTISFRAVAEKIDTLDSLAAAQDRSRSYLINEAISNYIELHAYQDALGWKRCGKAASQAMMRS